MTTAPGNSSRCAWCGQDALYQAYHDREWGVPLHDDRALFELLTLEGAQAGLSWITVLRKRDNYRAAFAGFDPAQVARFGPTDEAALLTNPGIVRNRLKVASTITNARAFLAIQAEFGSFDAWLWRFVEGNPIQNSLRSLLEGQLRRRTFHRLRQPLDHFLLLAEQEHRSKLNIGSVVVWRNQTDARAAATLDLVKQAFESSVPAPVSLLLCDQVSDLLCALFRDKVLDPPYVIPPPKTSSRHYLALYSTLLI